MEHEKQVQNVKRALELEKQLDALKNALNKEQRKAFGKPKPNPPTRKTAQFTKPTVKPQCKINWWMMFLPAGIDILLGMLTEHIIPGLSILLGVLVMPTLFIWPFVYYFAIYRNQKKADIERQTNSAEYKRQCAEAKAEADRMQKAYDDEYTEEKSRYDNVIMPKYQAEYSEWENAKNARINQLERELAKVRSELSELYEQTRIVPSQYRNIYALQHIYDMISTSDYDVHQAIENFDKSEQRRLDRMRLQEQQKANAYAVEQNKLIDEQNDLIDEQNTIARKARRDANIAAVVGAVQRHNINKNLKK